MKPKPIPACADCGAIVPIPLPCMSEKCVPVGARIKFPNEKLAYKVQARSKRYLVCTKPFNPKRTVLYSIIDIKQLVRGTENLVFGFGAETQQQCRDMVARLTLPKTSIHKTEVSRRNRVDLEIEWIRIPHYRFYRVDDYQIYAGESFEDAVQRAMEDTGNERADFNKESRALPRTYKIYDTDEDDNPTVKITLQQALDNQGGHPGYIAGEL